MPRSLTRRPTSCCSLGWRTGLAFSDRVTIHDVRVLVRPDWACFDGPLRGHVTRVGYRGTVSDHDVDTHGGTVTIRTSGPPRVRPGAEVTRSLRRAWVFDGQGKSLGVSAM